MWWRRRPDGSPSSGPTSPREALEERLSAYLDDEVGADERAEIEAILEADESARAHLEDLRLVSAALASLGEVRAPRSFAIPAPAGAAAGGAPAFRALPGRSLLVMRRLEWAMRASAAGAALLFVVAVTNDPGGSTPTAGFPSFAQAQQEQPSAFAAPDARTGDDAGAAGAAEMAPMGTPSPAGDGVPSEGGTGGGIPEDQADTQALPAPGGDPGDGEADKRIDPSAETATLQAPEAGTFGPPAASEGVGGVAHSLAVLAVMLTALSVLMARTRGAARADRR